MHRRPLGFTIVELLVVIVVIGVLASISLVAYRGISNKAIEASVTADLSNTTKQFKLFQIENSGFPTTIDCTQPNSLTNKCIKPSSNNELGVYTVNNSASPQTFCLTIKASGNIKKNINQDGTISDGACTYAFASTLVATTASRSQINLSWGAITSATSYSVEKSTDSSFTNPTNIYTGSGTSTSSTGLAASTIYYYRIKVNINGDDSSWSNTANATTSDFAGPTGLAMTSHTTTSISLSWSSIAGASYTLERSASSSFTSPTTAYSGTNTSTTVTGLVANTNYYFRVRATESGSTSAWSDTLLAMTVTTVNYATAGSFTWQVPVGITSITIETWGAQGSNGGSIGAYSGGVGGKGGYSKGNLAVTAGSTVYIKVGSMTEGGVGGGGGYFSDSECSWEDAAGGNGGGASDVRYGGNTTGNRKIIGGGGAGGSGAYDSGSDYCGRSSGSTGGYGGGTSGGGSSPGTQSTGISSGEGGNGTYSTSGGGGDGYYGGYSDSGGSGYIGGITSTVITAGNASMPAPGGGNETGHSGVGYVRITY
jgi:prepilin-type N-terminal cleavage/methylation domain-containing protein